MKTPILIESETLTLLECARVALSDNATFTRIAENLDLLDDELIKLRDRLEEYMNAREETDPFLGRFSDGIPRRP